MSTEAPGNRGGREARAQIYGSRQLIPLGIDAFVERMPKRICDDALTVSRTMQRCENGPSARVGVFLEAEGRFRLAPLYDVMSAWPLTGSGANLFQRKKLKLAMSVSGRNKHYFIDSIQRRHWNETAKRNAMGPDFESAVEEVLSAVPGVIEKVAAELPADFPAAVSGPIFEGILAQASRLAATPG